MEIRNRIVQLPHGVSFTEMGDLRPTRRHAAYYQRRAAGGVGFVIMESSVASLDGQARFPLTLSSDPLNVEGYRAIAEAVHREGARMGGQITHYGNQASSTVTRRPLIAPSTLGDPIVRESSRAMTQADMARVRDDFTTAARNFVSAGFDAVELKLAHDGLLRQFMSPLTNDRVDSYGGSTQNRLRFPLEVLEAVRHAIGSTTALGVRLVVDECFDGGYGLDEGLRFAELLGQSGVIDYISSDVGITASGHWITPPMGVPEGYAEQAYAGITRVSGVTVIACGQISTPAYAERILAEGKASAIGMARQILAEPDWALKALSGNPERIRPCTRCNQLCVGNALAFLPISCTVNPLAGHGERFPPVGDDGGQRVTIVGGGPAGMEAARVAAENGNLVTLYEATDRLGGQLDLAARVGGRTGWRPYLDWLERELERLGVAIEFQRRATVEQVLSSQPDYTIIACGSIPGEPPISGGSVATLDEFIACPREVQRVALVDFGTAGMALWSAALEAARRGATEVTVITPLSVIGADVDGATYLRLREDFARLGIRALTEHTVTEVSSSGLTARDRYGGLETSIAVDAVVGAMVRRSVGDDLASGLAGRVPVRVIGDALVPRDAAVAIREGQEVAGIELGSAAS